jgi:hypothetical protein
MEPGYATALGLIGDLTAPDTPRLLFVVPGERTSANPVKAFQQGLHGERDSKAYLLRGYRCPGCGVVELSATEESSS